MCVYILGALWGKINVYFIFEVISTMYLYGFYSMNVFIGELFSSYSLSFAC